MAVTKRSLAVLVAIGAIIAMISTEALSAKIHIASSKFAQGPPPMGQMPGQMPGQQGGQMPGQQGGQMPGQQSGQMPSQGMPGQTMSGQSSSGTMNGPPPQSGMPGGQMGMPGGTNGTFQNFAPNGTFYFSPAPANSGK